MSNPPVLKKRYADQIRLISLGTLAAMSYLLFFPEINQLNNLIFMKGSFFSAICVLLTVVIHAYIYGSFVDSMLKMIGSRIHRHHVHH